MRTKREIANCEEKHVAYVGCVGSVAILRAKTALRMTRDRKFTLELKNRGIPHFADSVRNDVSCVSHIVILGQLGLAGLKTGRYLAAVAECLLL